MSNKQDFLLKHTLSQIRNRWGVDALRKHMAVSGLAFPRLGTGLTALDEITGGGIPIGRITELVGTPTSGMTTLVMKLIAHAQREKGESVFIDLAQALSPDYAAMVGIDLGRMLVVRPQNPRDVLNIAFDIIASRSATLIALATPFPISTVAFPAAGLRRLALKLSKTSCVFIVASESSPSLVSPVASLRLKVSRRKWLESIKGNGWRAQVEVIKNNSGPVGGKASFDIWLDRGLS